MEKKLKEKITWWAHYTHTHTWAMWSNGGLIDRLTNRKRRGAWVERWLVGSVGTRPRPSDTSVSRHEFRLQNFFRPTLCVSRLLFRCVCVCRLGSSPPGGTLKGRRLDETFECNERDRCLRCIRHVDYLSSSLTRRNGNDNLLLPPPPPPVPLLLFDDVGIN